MIVSTAACVGFPRAAFAGYYVKTYVGGTSSPFDRTHNDAGGSERDNYQSYGTVHDLNSNYYDYNATGTASYSGTITAEFNWVSTSPSDIPPQCVVIKETSGVSYDAGPQQNQPTGQANNGLDGTAVSIYTPESDGRSMSYWSVRGNSSGYRKTVKQNPGMHFTTSCNLSAQASGKHASISVSYRSVVQYRAASISREGARGEIIDAEGMTHGDTIYSALWVENSPFDHAIDYRYRTNWQTFHAQWFSDWSSGTTGIWSPAFSTATSAWNTWSMPYGNIHYERGIPYGTPTGPTERTLTYTVSDISDGASVTARYYMTIHDAVEDLTVTPEGITEKHQAAGSNSTLSGPWPLPGNNEVYKVTCVTQAGVWSFQGGIEAWFLVFGISYQAESTSSEIGAEFTGTLTSTQHARLMQTDNIDLSHIRWYQYDEAGLVPGSMADKRQEVTNRRQVSQQYHWEGPFPNGGGFHGE